jgi:hypothetical protein
MNTHPHPQHADPTPPIPAAPAANVPPDAQAGAPVGKKLTGFALLTHEQRVAMARTSATRNDQPADRRIEERAKPSWRETSDTAEHAGEKRIIIMAATPHFLLLRLKGVKRGKKNPLRLGWQRLYELAVDEGGAEPAEAAVKTQRRPAAKRKPGRIGKIEFAFPRPRRAGRKEPVKS